MPKMVFWVTEVGEKDNEIVGKKCANLGQMAKLGLQVPPCFFISIEAYNRFMSETNLGGEIRRYISGFGDLKKMGIKDLEKMSGEVKQLIKNKDMSPVLKDQIGSSYRTLCKRAGEADLAVSVRSSGTESRPGMFATYFNVMGEKGVVEKTKDVWASAFTARALAFRINKDIPIDGDSLGVAVVKMVHAKAAGVSFSVDPVKGDPSRIVIEATWGLGEGVVKGTESVDRFLVNKETVEIERQIGKKEKQVVVCNKDGIRWEDVPPDKTGIACLSDDEIKQIANLTKFLEERLGQPQDVEWAIEQGSSFPANVYLLQTRPAKIAMGKKSSISEQLCEDVTKTFRKIDVSKLRMPGADFKI
jgi:pyruvate,water dikinase